jgi:hypothetical protein
MKTIPNENELEEMLEQVPVEPCEETSRLRAAPWTERGARHVRTPWIAAVTAPALALVFLVTPPGRAWAQQAFLFFKHADTDTFPLSPQQLTAIFIQDASATPIINTVTPVYDAGYDFSLSIEDAGQKAGFGVMAPDWIPPVLSFVGASYETDHNIVRLYYRHNKYPDINNGLILREEKFKTFDDCHLCGVVGASEPIEAVNIGNNTGEYILGVWILTNQGAEWESTPMLQTLRWQQDGLAFELQYMGVAEDENLVTKDDLISIAASIK